MDFGATIRAWRNDADLSLRELADRVGINFTQLSKMETGALGPPSDEQVRSLALALGRSDEDTDALLALAHDTNISPSEVRSVLIKNPEVGALLRRIQQRPRQRLSDQEAALLGQLAPGNETSKDNNDGATSS